MTQEPFAGSGKRGQPAGAERRAAERYPGTKVLCRLSRPERGAWLPAWVRDISVSGISLLAERRFEPGTLLVLQLENTQTKQAVRLEMVVVHTVPCPNDAWLHGGAFRKELGAQELRGIVE
jgi:hypothetical protein